MKSFDLKKLRQHYDAVQRVDLKYMSYSSEAVLQQTPLLSRLLMWTLVALLVVMFTWAAVAEIDEFTRAEGRVVPSSDVQVVQNLEGGLLAQMMVSEGELVERDQPLLQIDDTLFSSTYRERSLQAEQLAVKAARLHAEIHDTIFEDELLKLEIVPDSRAVISERELLQARRRDFELRIAALAERVQQRRQELSSIRVERETIAGSYELLSREVTLSRPMVEQGAMSRVELLRLERQANDLKGQMDRASLAIPQLESALQEALGNVESFEQGFRSEAQAELSEINAELNRLRESNQALEDRVRRTVVRSPVRGTIKQIRVHTTGGVIQPGMDLVEIVPLDDSLLIEASVHPRDIAFIRPAQEATVKFTAYDFSIHGGLSAEVVHISPDTIRAEDGASFYQIRLQTLGGHLGKGQQPLPIIPGMTVQVDVLTGRKTILNYLMKPIFKTRELALRER